VKDVFLHYYRTYKTLSFDNRLFDLVEFYKQNGDIDFLIVISDRHYLSLCKDSELRFGAKLQIGL